MNRRIKSLNLVVLAFYLLYALLPLLYSTGSVHAETASTGSAYQSVTVRDVSVPEQDLLPGVLEDQGGSSAHILLKKKRAISPSFNKIAATSALQYAQYAHFKFLSTTAVVPSKMPDGSPDCPDGFSYYHSGASPPAA